VKILNSFAFATKLALLALSALAALGASAINIPSQPLSIQDSAKPMIMLALGRDHRMFYEAYNDASDIDGDGTLDIRFKPAITYLGLFNSTLCYTHSGPNDDPTKIEGLFTPVGAAGLLNTCSGQWSGNWLNYVTTSRIDALRVVMYGGMRDSSNSGDTGSQTILRRAYIPQDAHSWAKEYHNLATDGYLISSYTPLAQPTDAAMRHFFGNLTQNSSKKCDPLSDCSDRAPWLSVVTNSNLRVWQWASTERPVLNGSAGGTRTNYTVRVSVCTPVFNMGCKLYPNGNYKPVGLLHDFGENDSALFGLFSGSYDSHLSGGRLRKVMSSFTNEVDSNNGTFTATTGIVHNFNSFRIYGFNRGGASQIYQGTVVGNRVVNQGEFPDWGNPIAEQMYEAVRYLANKSTPSGSFTGVTTIDDIMGLSKPSWDRPYAGQGTSTAQAPYCARSSLLTISDTNISFDSDQLPGVNSNFGGGISTDLSGVHIINNAATNLNVSVVADFITANEPGLPNSNRFIGQSGAAFDSAPTAKSVASLSSIRGLAPEEPTKRGSYYAASVAHYAKVNDLNSGLTGKQTVDTYAVALASPLPRIDARLPNGKIITLVPFAKSVGGAFSIGNAKTGYQPTNQIVDFYVESIANSGPEDANASINSGRYQATFRINYEDVEQGNDHDMDAIATYTVRANADNTLEVTVQPIYEAGGVNHRMGYVISGTTQDGIYLVTQDTNNRTSYFLNVPPGRTPGYCDTTPVPGDCFRLPFLGGTTTAPAAQSTGDATSAISQFVFTPSTASAASLLKDPLWYAAKWGGFNDANNDGRADLKAEWDLDNDGLPDNYFFVQNPTKMRDSLTKAFRSIVDRPGSSSNLASNASGRVDTDSKVYRASYVAGKWVGDIEAYAVTINGVGNAPVWAASAQLPTWDARALYLQTNTNTVADMRSTAFTSLTPHLQTALVSEGLYNYLRGNKSNEAINGGSFRTREKLLGDIIHSSPAYDLESNTLYVGSNGGFLHAFNGVTGSEKFGFMPLSVTSRVKDLAGLAYGTSHQYYVDGETYLGLKFAATNSNYYIYSMLGRGGKGMFSINPGTSGNSPALLWDYTVPLSTVNTTSTASIAAADPDLGLMLSSPVGTLMNNGKFAVIAGNGYNSVSGKAVLYIFIINADGSLDSVKKIDTGVGGDNGLSGPSGYDATADGKADFLYAGDFKGNLWKFDVRDANPDNWKLAFTGANAGLPLFKATDAAGNPQPITVPITPVFNAYNGGDPSSNNKVYLFFGTGSYLQVGDNTNLNRQSWYGIIDDDTGLGDGTPVPTDATIRSALTRRQMSSPLNSSAGFTIRYAGGDVANDMAGKRGWFMDFVNPVNGERITNPSVFLPQAVKPALQVTSFFPITGDVCVPGGDSYVNIIDPFTGTNLKEDVLLGKPLGGGALIPVGSLLNNPAPLTGAEHTNLYPSSRKLNVGIATTPINLGTGSSPSSIDSPWTGLGIVYGATGAAAKSDFNRWNSRVAVKTPTPPKKDCAGTLISIISGSEGIEDSGTRGCEENRLKGRISWREILKD
jgi:type IV pilus assembly protein PilY1